MEGKFLAYYVREFMYTITNIVDNLKTSIIIFDYLWVCQKVPSLNICEYKLFQWLTFTLFFCEVLKTTNNSSITPLSDYKATQKLLGLKHYFKGALSSICTTL